MDGFILLYRAIFNSKLYFAGKFDKTHAWIDLLLLANYSDSTIDKRGISVEVKRGQIAKSIDFFCERWQWSHKTVECFLKTLESSEQISIQRSRLINLISIVNYDKYQASIELCSEQNSEQNSEQSSEQIKKVPPIPPLQKYKKQSKQTKNVSNETSKSLDFDFSFVSEEFFEVFQKWLEYKASIGQKYKTQTTVKTAYNQLVRYSGGDVNVALEIVDKSIANSWRGLFEPKENELMQIKARYIPLEDRQKAFYNELTSYLGEYDKTILRGFYNKWAEPNQSGKFMKKELESTWDTKTKLELYTQHETNRTGAQPPRNNIDAFGHDIAAREQRFAAYGRMFEETKQLREKYDDPYFNIEGQ